MCVVACLCECVCGCGSNYVHPWSGTIPVFQLCPDETDWHCCPGNFTLGLVLPFLEGAQSLVLSLVSADNDFLHELAWWHCSEIILEKSASGGRSFIRDLWFQAGIRLDMKLIHREHRMSSDFNTYVFSWHILPQWWCDYKGEDYLARQPGWGRSVPPSTSSYLLVLRYGEDISTYQWINQWLGGNG